MNGPERDDADDGRQNPSASANPSTGAARGPGAKAPVADASPNAVRNWSALLSFLALASFLSAGTALFVSETPRAAAGATMLGLGLVGTAVVSRTMAPNLLYRLSAAWAEHRRYVWFSGGLFALGIAAGIALAAAGVDLTQLFLELIMEELEGAEVDPDGLGGGGGVALETSATFFILNNTPPFLASILGALTLGLFTFFVMTLNGLIVGNIAVAIGGEVGYGLVVALLVPHGIFELTALFVGAGVGFRFVYRAGERVLGKRPALFTKPYLARTALLVVFAWLMLVVAAFVEAYLTIPVAEFLFPTQTA
ncbi:stage II sporulation protein M [Halostagnicola larsenii]|nr:stage II sporulation protein M [Halostagnicola larsenii]